MKILIVSVSTSSHRAGGVERHLGLLTTALLTLGHEVHWLTTAPAGDSGPGTPGPEAGVRWHRVAGVKPGVHGPSWWRASGRLFAALQSEQGYDAVLSEGISALGLTKLEGRPPIAVFLQGFEPEHILNQWWDLKGPVGAAKYVLIRVPEVLVLSALERRMVLKADRVLGAAPHILDRVRRFYGAAPDRLGLFPNWIDLEAYRFTPEQRRRTRAELELKDGQTAFLFAGVLSPQKGARLALEAFQTHSEGEPGSRLLVAGDGTELEGLKVSTLRMGMVSKVRFLGHLPPARLAQVYGAADAFLMPTRRIEGMPYVLLEAAAAGLPVVCTRRGGNESTLGPEARWVAPGDVEAFRRAMDGLAASPAIRRNLGTAARDWVSSRFAEPLAVERLKVLLQTLMRPGG